MLLAIDFLSFDISSFRNASECGSPVGNSPTVLSPHTDFTTLSRQNVMEALNGFCILLQLF